MKDFKKENGYDNMETEKDTYDGVILKNWNEGYRYYSASSSASSSGGSGGSSNGSGGSSGSSGSSNGSGSSSGSSGSASCYNCGGTGYVGSGNCSICNPSGVSADCSYCSDTGWYGSYLCTYCGKGDSIEPIIINTTTESISSCLVKLSVSASCCEPTNRMYIYVYSAGTSNVKYSTMASSYHVEGEKELLFGSYEIEVLAYIGNGMVKRKKIPIELEVNKEFDDSEVYPMPEYVIRHTEDIYYNYGYNNYTVTINANCENSDRLEVEVVNEPEAEKSGLNYRFVLNEGGYTVKIRAYVGSNIVEESLFEINLYKEELEITPLDITKGAVKSNGAYDVTFDTSCNMAYVMYLWVYDNDNNNNLIYSASGSNYILDTAELHPGNYNVVIDAVRPQNPCGYKRYEKTLIFDETETNTGGGIGGGSIVITPEVEDIPDNERKFLLLYTGPTYDEFEDEHIKKVIACGATDFVLLTAASLNYDVHGNRIIDPITNYADYTAYESDVAFEKYNEYYPGVLEKLGIKQDTYDNAIDLHKHLWGLGGENGDEVIDAVANADLINNGNRVFEQLNLYVNRYEISTANYSVYAESVAILASNMVALNPTSRLWIGLPPILEGARHLAEDYKEAYKDLIEEIKDWSERLSCPFWDNVVGIYFGTEDIPTGYAAFEEDKVNENFNCPVVRTMRWLKDVCLKTVDTTKDLQLLWIPYYRNFVFEDTNEATGIPTRIGSVVNNTDIFDFVILQPSRYFEDNCQNVIKLVADCAAQNVCLHNKYTVNTDTWTYIPDGDEYVQAGGNYEPDNIQRALIGVEMEIDTGINDKTTDKSTRYAEYVDGFGKFILGFGDNMEKRPVAFYAGDKNALMDDTVYGRVKDFFTGNIVITESDN